MVSVLLLVSVYIWKSHFTAVTPSRKKRKFDEMKNERCQCSLDPDSRHPINLGKSKFHLIVRVIDIMPKQKDSREDKRKGSKQSRLNADTGGKSQRETVEIKLGSKAGETWRPDKETETEYRRKISWRI